MRGSGAWARCLLSSDPDDACLELVSSCLAVAALASPACVSVPSGHAGVLVTPDHGVDRETLSEGVHTVAAGSHVDVYDLRAQEQTEDLEAISADGANLSARASLVTFHLPADELPSLVRTIEPDYYRSLIAPVVRSTVRRVLGRYRADELGTANVRHAQEEIAMLSAGRLRPYHIVLDSIVLRGVFAVAPITYAKVLETAELEQKALGAPQQLSLARSRASAAITDAIGVAAAQKAIAPTLAPGVLANLGREAWERVLRARSTIVVIHSADQPFQMEISP